jgi:DNA-directed RNA polymerase sigma subunit (sigma70/sigma32)
MHNEPYFLTFEEIGMGLGVTRQRVQQLHAEHLELLDKARKARRK